ncbi:unnamed protein product [Soboliphyme baturini]|uniref:UBC core domain-containing protein n=1 Tax=Soboliphyme baturini TaxID=241478 RepID=A0A183J7Y7_9BILA|nr:unnamed protein product [Soboliphyme baturini]
MWRVKSDLLVRCAFGATHIDKPFIGTQGFYLATEVSHDEGTFELRDKYLVVYLKNILSILHVERACGSRGLEDIRDLHSVATTTIMARFIFVLLIVVIFCGSGTNFDVDALASIMDGIGGLLPEFNANSLPSSLATTNRNDPCLSVAQLADWHSSMARTYKMNPRLRREFMKQMDILRQVFLLVPGDY